MRSFTVVSLLLVCCAAVFVGAANPCDVTLDSIHADMQSANDQRQACEKSFFSSSACDSYWTLVNSILTKQINFQDCGKKTQDQFYVDVKNNIATEGSTTRTSVVNNAKDTQAKVQSENENTRAKVTSEATRTIQTVNDKTDAQHAQTRSTISSEAAATRGEIDVQHAITDQYIHHNTTTVLSTTISQATQTRADVDAQHDNTRATLKSTIQTEGTASRKKTEDESVATRTLISNEMSATRDHVTAQATSTRQTVSDQAASTRTTQTAEATSTRAYVLAQHTTTRTAISNAATDVKNTVASNANATQQVVASQSQSTRNTVQSESTNTQATVTNAFNANTASLNALQSSQNNFTALFIQIMIMMDFSSTSARVDLFQRPASLGGYFETTRALVRQVLDTNKQIYSWTNYKIGTAETYWSYGEAKYNLAKPDYRGAWEYYRNAYLAATINGWGI